MGRERNSDIVDNFIQFVSVKKHLVACVIMLKVIIKGQTPLLSK